MADLQKGTIIIGLLAVLSTLFFAPLRIEGTTGIGEASRYASATVHKGVWEPPMARSIEMVSMDGRGQDVFFVSSAQVDAAQLGLWWFGILIVTAAAVLLKQKTK